MSKFEKVKKYYNSGLWNEKRVRNAVVKGWITEDECTSILKKQEGTSDDGN